MNDERSYHSILCVCVFVVVIVHPSLACVSEITNKATIACGEILERIEGVDLERGCVGGRAFIACGTGSSHPFDLDPTASILRLMKRSHR